MKLLDLINAASDATEEALAEAGAWSCTFESYTALDDALTALEQARHAVPAEEGP